MYQYHYIISIHENVEHNFQFKFGRPLKKKLYL